MPDAVRATCAAIASAAWSDALDRLGITGIVMGLTWRAGASRVAGPCVTVRAAVGELGSAPIEAFDVAAVLRATGAGDVLVIDAAGAQVSTMGGLLAAAARARGISGVVVDGACRDLEEIRATGLSIVSRHVTPTSGKQRVRIEGIGVPIRCGGVPVRPGDFIVADETGTVVIPSERFEEAFALAQKLDTQDQLFRAALEAGHEFGEVAASLRHL